MHALPTLADLSPLSLIEILLPIHEDTQVRGWSLQSDFRIPPIAYRSVDAGSTDDKVTAHLTAQLEMYGGAGLGPNAGGVRCANLPTCQIKGIGSTLLAGPGPDKWHRHGALSLQDAVRETIMGELIHTAGPSGAVRALGIADLGFGFTTEIGVEKLPGSAPRALLFRQLSVRVAHFMRSSFMNVGDELAEREMMRMRDGTPRLVDWLCRFSQVVNFQVASDGLLFVFEALMNQMAVLRTKRLVHGSLIPSNVCLDGRLVDFTTSTAVSTLQPVMVALGGLTTHQQHTQILMALPELLFYIAKFDKRCNATRVDIEERSRALAATLTGMHHNFLMREHLGLLGLPVQNAMQLPAAVKSPILGALVKAIESGSREGQLYFGGDEHQMLPQTGRDDLFSLVAEAIRSITGLRLPASANYEPRPQAFAPAVIHDFIRAFRCAVEKLPPSQLSGVEKGVSWLIRAMQRNADLTPLYRRNMDGVINEVCTRKGADFATLIAEVLHDWTAVFDCPPDGTIMLRGWLTAEDVYLTPDGLLRVREEVLSPLALSQFVPAPRARPRHRWLFELAACNCLH